MQRLRELFWLHYETTQPLTPLWDEWIPPSTLWPALGEGAQLESLRHRWAAALAGRVINAEGYVHTQQHNGPAHAEGWPFPLWTQAGGIGWHFAPLGVQGYEGPPATPEGWRLTSGAGGELTDKGWPVELTDAGAIAQTPPFAIEAHIAPWLRLNWRAEGLEGADCWVEWTTADAPDFSPERRVYFSPAPGPKLDLSATEMRTMIRVYHLSGWSGTITGLRIGFDNAGPARLVIQSFHTASDTRHPINNLNFIRGYRHYFAWTGDRSFLRAQLPRLRTAMRYVLHEFDTRRRRCIYVVWPGHEGRSGVRPVDGQTQVTPGEGIGNNYWDLLPFGGEDALASIYHYDALHALAELESAAAAHPEWNIPGGADAFDPADLRAHAAEVRDYGTKRFWNAKTGRFGTVDLDGAMHDYGFTFLNNEAVYYGFATAEQARATHAWLAGDRTVEGDTSTGADIYHWRFGPRSTTRRNLDYYFWFWGDQVQDGGAVLGFSYHDLMARLATAGPDDAWRRLQPVLEWFAEVQAAAGYRAYYAVAGRGTMQGGNVPGGLGLDKEFFESILVPLVMLYGFLDLRASAEGFIISPRLPADWPELTITRVHLRDHVVDIRVAGETIEVTDYAPDADLVEIRPGLGWTLCVVAPRNEGR